MTPNCIKNVEKLYQENEVFQDLTIEQLLYSAIKGTGLDEVRRVLHLTDWSEWVDKKDLD